MKSLKLLVAGGILLLSAQKQLSAQFISGGSGTTVLQTSTDLVGIGVTPVWKLDLAGDFNISAGSVFRYNDTPFVVQTSNNLFVGMQAGQSNTTGKFGSAFGIGAGYSNTTGEYNTFIGYNAGYSSTISKGSTFIGAYAGYKCNTSTNTYSRNTFIGYSAGYNNTTGSNNLVMGHETGYGLTTGRSNVYVGNNAGKKDSLAENNTFIGSATGFDAIGKFNTFIGYGSGYSIQGSNNALLGYSTGYNASGYENTYLGSDAGSNSLSSDSNICIGSGSTASDNSDNNIVIGNNAALPDNSVNRAVIAHRGTVLCDSCMVLGDTTVNGTYHVGIGTNAPTHQLQLSTSDGAKVGSGSWVIVSDQRLKKDIKPFTEGLSTINKINPVWFKYNGAAGISTNQEFVGVLAQEIKEVAPYMVGKHTYIDQNENKEEYLSFDGDAIKYITINAIKEQQAQIEEKDKQIKALTEELVKTNQRIDALLESLGKKEPVVSPESGNLSATEVAKLYQNVPNPFSNSTTIKFFIPAQAKTATIEVYDVATNKAITTYNVAGIKGDGQVEYTAQGAIPNTLVYKLIINDVVVDQKKMIQQ